LDCEDGAAVVLELSPSGRYSAPLEVGVFETALPLPEHRDSKSEHVTLKSATGLNTGESEAGTIKTSPFAQIHLELGL
jgi:hypothetical protein